MPLGSSSAAPVTRPGPNRRNNSSASFVNGSDKLTLGAVSSDMLSSGPALSSALRPNQGHIQATRDRSSASTALSNDWGCSKNFSHNFERRERSDNTERIFHCSGLRSGVNSLQASGVETGAPSRGRKEKTEASDCA